MDFIEDLPSSQGNNVIMVDVDRLSKYDHLLVLSHPYIESTIVQLFIGYVFKLHGMPLSIVSNCDHIFVSSCWKEFSGCKEPN